MQAKKKIPNKQEGLGDIIDFSKDFLLKKKFPYEAIGIVHLIIDEITTNIIKYSNAKNIVVTFTLLPEDKLKITFDDDGNEFNLLNYHSSTEKDTGGIGIEFVKELVNSINYNRTKNKNIINLILKV